MVLHVVVITVGQQSLSAADAVAVRPRVAWRRHKVPVSLGAVVLYNSTTDLTSFSPQVCIGVLTHSQIGRVGAPHEQVEL